MILKASMVKFLVTYRQDLLLLMLLTLSLPLFFYKLGQSSLVSWDEAWYGAIAQNIIDFGDILNLRFNGERYLDHPPMGFWLMAVSIKLFGPSEFWVRFPSAIAGLLSLYAIYFLGKEMFSRLVGFVSAVALTSAIWFLYRARSGNLDSFLTLFFLTTIFLALKASKNEKFLIPFIISLLLLFLTKTLVPFTIIPSLVIIFWGSKIKFRKLLKIGIIFLAGFGGWVMSQYTKNPDFFQRYFFIGLPGVEVKTSYLDNLKQIKEYLHGGIGKWFWPGIAGIGLGSFFFQKRFLILLTFFIAFFIPFIFSSRGSIWHLVPLHPILILGFFGFISVFLERVLSLIPNSFIQKKHRNILVALPILGICFYYTHLQLKQSWFQFIDIPAYVSDEAILSKEAGKYVSSQFFIDGDFTPAAVFYSGKKVRQLWGGGMKDLFEKENNFVLITKQYRLDSAQISSESYRVLKQDRDKILILRNNE